MMNKDQREESRQSLLMLSPLDGRYRESIASLRKSFSEYGLTRARLIVEIRWLLALAKLQQFKKLYALDEDARAALRAIADNFDAEDAERIKHIEGETRHDVKALEYFIRERCLEHPKLAGIVNFIHFACTSEDINNLAYASMLHAARDEELIPRARAIIETLCNLGEEHSSLAMLARTHGQPASPTTLGKELAVFIERLCRQWQHLCAQAIRGKINGASGNYNAHVAAYPEVDWEHVSRVFVEDSLGFEWSPCTTQIEPHDYIAELSNTLNLFNVIAIDLCRDLWGYIALGYFTQQRHEKEVGSSTMPHKINPIDFENAEGNLGMANTLFAHFSQKLPISRWQRDLSDSTVMRNIGVAMGHSCLAWEAIQRGLGKLTISQATIASDLQANPEVIAEAVQSVMRRHGAKNAYEQLKQLTRGARVSPERLENFIDKSDLPEEAAQTLKRLEPGNYTGIAAKLATETIARTRKKLNSHS